MIPLQEDGKQLLYTSIVFMVAATVAVALRLIAKQKTKSRFAWDDLYTILALIDFAAYNGVIISSVVDIGGTYDPLKLTNLLPQTSEILKFLWIAELFLSWGITLVKVSILAFYGSIFTTPTFRFAKRVVLAFCLMWCIAMTAGVIFQCHPVKAAWDPLRTSKKECTLFGSFVLGYEISNIAIDIAILCLPIYMIRRLHLPAKQRWILSFIFLLGGFVCVTAILRIVYSFNPKQPNAVRSFSLGMVWSTVELGTAIICGCLPTYRPLLHDSKLPAPVRAWFVSAIHSARGLRSKSTGQSSSQKTYGDSGSGYKKFHDDAHSDDVHSQDTEEGGWTKGAEDGPAHPLKAITVERRVEIV